MYNVLPKSWLLAVIPNHNVSLFVVDVPIILVSKQKNDFYQPSYFLLITLICHLKILSFMITYNILPMSWFLTIIPIHNVSLFVVDVTIILVSKQK